MCLIAQIRDVLFLKGHTCLCRSFVVFCVESVPLQRWSPSSAASGFSSSGFENEKKRRFLVRGNSALSSFVRCQKPKRHCFLPSAYLAGARWMEEGSDLQKPRIHTALQCLL